jgi:hypothetical protein
LPRKQLLDPQPGPIMNDHDPDSFLTCFFKVRFAGSRLVYT